MLVSTGYAVENIQALKAIPRNNLVDGYLKLVKRDAAGSPALYSYQANSIKAPDDDLVVNLSDNLSVGRFIRVWEPIPEFRIGTVVGTDDPNGASCTMEGTLRNPVLNLVIPRGARGKAGIGIPGEKGEPGIGGIPKLETNLAYYVSTTGNDNNDGLSSSTPFATIQKFIDTIEPFDLNGNYVFCSVAEGTYTNPVYLKPLKGIGGAIILGDFPATATMSVTSQPCFYAEYITASASYYLSNFTVETLGGSGAGIDLYNCEYFSIRNFTFKSTTAEQIYIDGRTYLDAYDITVDGNAYTHLYIYGYSRVEYGGTFRVNAPSFSDHFLGIAGGSEAVFTGSFVGTATGSKYNLEGGSKIFLRNGLTEANIPGNAPGVIEPQVVIGG